MSFCRGACTSASPRLGVASGLRQPVVFLGSEGEVAVIARDLGAYLWVLAEGFGPLEATMHPHHEHDPQPDVRLARIAQRYAPADRREPGEIFAAAKAEFPGFETLIESACRWGPAR